MYHLLNNLKTKFKSKTKELEYHYIQTAKSYSLQDFHVLFYTLCSAVPREKDYLKLVGLDRWTRSHAPSRRYNIMTTNISESLNAMLVKVRELPITAFVNEVICVDQYTFDVIDGDRNYCVDMVIWTCTCQKFQLDQLPCDHVLAVVRKTSYDAYDLCSLYYAREFLYESYRGVVHPIPHISSWSLPSHIFSFDLKPPDVCTIAGRHRKRRIPSVGEELSTTKCSRCKESGHNRVNCQNPIALHPTNETGTLVATIHPNKQVTS
ncbi:hypothetical protein UlMin_036747 [Ulmus minor]